ncbi:mitochondrial 37S ribosomal protein uS11m [Aspergillus lucknowensis]|uniref:Translational machinery component n=1 Tax=Aspergillus lucknowensis TaxID=176173 RepID=A0ABR4M692_9EURO
MNNTFASALARALPSIGRQCQPRASLLRQTRVFSSTSHNLTNDPERRELASQLPGGRPDGPAEENSSLSAITRLMRGDKRPMDKRPVSSDYARVAESLETNMLRRPYADYSPPHHLHVYSHKHNTVLTLTRPNGNPLLSMGCGHLGFRKSKRSGYDAAFQLTSHVFGQIQERGLLMDIQSLEIVLRGFGQGREAFTKVLLGNEGRNIRGLVSKVTDSTRLKFGGTRSPRVRRLG